MTTHPKLDVGYLATVPLCIHANFVERLLSLYRTELVVVEHGIVNPISVTDEGTAIMQITGVIDYKPSWATDAGFAVSSQQMRHDVRRLANDDTI